MALLEKLRHLSARLSSAGSASFILFILIMLVYLPGTCTHPHWDDSAEFVFISHNWGIAHPSGYPLYTIIINLIEAISPPSAWGISIFSAAAAAAAIVLWHLILVRLGVHRVFAFVCALIIAQATGMYGQAVIQEVYTFNVFLQLLVLHRAIVFLDSQRRSDLYLTAFFLGLSFSHHLTSFWLLPALAYMLWPEFRKIQQKRPVLLKMAAAMLAGLLFYLYLPIRSAMQPLWDQGNPETPGNFISVVSGDVFRYRLFSLDFSEITAQVGDWFDSLWEQWGLLYVLFAIPGLWRVMQFNKRIFTASILWLAAALIYCFNYYIPDKDGYYLIPHLLVGTFALSGLSLTLRRLAALLPDRAVAFIAPLVLMLPLLGLFFMEESGHNRNTSLQDLTYDIWSEVQPGALLFSEDLNIHYSTALLQAERQLSTDRVVVATYLLSFKWYIDFLRKRWPDFVWPESIEIEIDRTEKRLRQVPARESGDIRQLGIDRIVSLIASANIGNRRIYAFIYEPQSETEYKYGFRMQKWGLVYRFVSEGSEVMPHFWNCDYSPRYLRGKKNLPGEREKHVASLYATSCNRLGIELAHNGRPEEAVEAMRKALRYDPDYTSAMKNMGAVLVQQLKRFDEGREVWNNYVSLARESGENPDPRVVEWLQKNK